jgi:subtilase family serine protease
MKVWQINEYINEHGIDCIYEKYLSESLRKICTKNHIAEEIKLTSDDLNQDNSIAINGNTTLRYEFGKVSGGKYRE